MSTTDLSALTRIGGPASSHVPRPSSRLLTRVVLPAGIVLAACGLIIYAARESFRPAISVHVAPAVLRTGGQSGVNTATPGEVVQAPGWIEADPSAVGVPALAGGVLKELLVLDGAKVEAGQVIAHLVDDDALLAERRARAAAAQAAAALAQAKASEAVEEARSSEIQDEVARLDSAAAGHAISEREAVAAKFRLQAQRAVVDAAKAAVLRAQADIQSAAVTVDEAALAVSRMHVRAPVAGVVLTRLVEPGQRLMPDANNPFAGIVLRLYDPAHLQVRVDVPLSDAAKVRVGDTAEITTETLPGRTFKGTLARFVHETNLQKNTVQVKVTIMDPAPELKPDMLAKARIMTRPSETSNATAASSVSGSVLMVPREALIDISGAQASAWVLDRETSTAVKRRLRLGRVNTDGAEVLDGLHPGDRVVLSPPASLKPDAKVRQLDEQEAK